MLEGTVVFEGNHRGVDLIIRHCRRDDVEQLLTFFNTLSKEQTFIMYQGKQLTHEEEEKYVTDFVKKAEKGYGVKLLAFHNDMLIGMGDVTRSTFEAESHIGAFGLMIARDWRGKGLGSFLMDKTLEEAKKYMTELKIIRLGVFKNNPVAENMYKKKGFVQYGNLPNGLLHRGEYVDHVYMYKQVGKFEGSKV